MSTKMAKMVHDWFWEPRQLPSSSEVLALGREPTNHHVTGPARSLTENIVNAYFHTHREE